MKGFPVLRVSGSPFERGFEIGEKAKKQIKHNIEAYKETFKEKANLDWIDAKRRAEKYVPWIEKYDSEILEEMIGISKGSGCELLDIVCLNARSEIILHPDGCTSIVFLSSVNSKKNTLLGQNWDWGNKFKDGVILLDIDQSPKPRILMATEAGIVGKIGMNNSGIGVCLNLLGTSEFQEGVPIHVVLRGILNSSNISQAIGQATRLRRGTSANFLIGYGKGEAINLEMTSGDYDVIYPTKGYFAHANHFIGPRKVNLNDTARLTYPDTHIRQGVADRLLEGINEFNKSTLKELFKNHSGYPDSICRHGEEYPTDLGRSEAVDTVFSIIMNLTEKNLEITYGQPCMNPYKRYEFN